MGVGVKKKIIISCVNFTEGGPLSVIYDCLRSDVLKKADLEVTVLVHRKSLFKEFENWYSFQEYPEIKLSWWKRVVFEYRKSKEISIDIKPDIWISLHDISANVVCPMQVVYCHNPAPFYKTKIKHIFYDYKFFLFSIFYKFLYRINIKKNRFVIVQQNWLRNEFFKNYNVPTIVAYPAPQITATHEIESLKPNDVKTFFYPSFPRIFKNFEVLFEAAALLARKRSDFRLLVTIERDQNRYSTKLYDKYKNVDNIEFIGKQTRDQVYEIFQSCDALVFPSKLETWGLPLTEAKQFNKIILASNLPYARENVQSYEQVKFFNPDDADQLAKYMEQVLDSTLQFDENEIEKPADPFFEDWDGLLKFLISESEKQK